MRVQVQSGRGWRLRGAGLALDVRGQAAGQADRPAAGLHPAVRVAGIQSGAGAGLSAQHRLAQAACVPEHAVRQRAAEEAPPGCADRLPASRGRGRARDRGRQRGPGVQPARLLRGAGGTQRRSHAGPGDGQCRPLAGLDALGHLGQRHQLGRPLRHGHGRHLFGQSGPGGEGRGERERRARLSRAGQPGGSDPPPGCSRP